MGLRFLVVLLVMFVLEGSLPAFQRPELKDVRVFGREAVVTFSGDIPDGSVSVEKGRGFVVLNIKGALGSSRVIPVSGESPLKKVYVSGMGDGVKITFEAKGDTPFLLSGFRFGKNSLSLRFSGGKSFGFHGENSGFLIYRSLFGILLVLGVMLPALWLIRRLMGMKRLSGKGDRMLRFIDAHQLSSKQMVAVIEVDGDLLVLGVTPERITTLMRKPRLDEVSGFQKEMIEEGGKIERSMDRVLGLIEEKISSLKRA